MNEEDAGKEEFYLASRFLRSQIFELCIMEK